MNDVQLIKSASRIVDAGNNLKSCGLQKLQLSRNWNAYQWNHRQARVSSEMCRVVMMSRLKSGSPAGSLIVPIRRVEVQCKSNQ